jgi:Ca-activated chloride channel homolog
MLCFRPICAPQAPNLTGPAASKSDPSFSDINFEPRPKIRVDSNLVVVPVTVTDGKGHVVTGLQKEHFSLYEDKVEQQITHFASEDAPASIGVILDTSDSMSPRLQKAREAVAALIRNSNSDDEFFLETFSDRTRFQVGLTTHHDELLSRLKTVHTDGGTALLDAVANGLNEMKNARYNRKTIVIVSDGEDNASHLTVPQLLQVVHDSDALIYAIGLVDSYGSSWQASTSTAGAMLLKHIATESGGRLFVLNKLKQLPEITSKIGLWVRNQYILAFSPANIENRQGYHRIQVKISKPRGFPTLHAAWRLGYYTPAQ